MHGDELDMLTDKIDQTWNDVSTVYEPFDERATFAGGQAEPYTVMDERMSILNSTLHYEDDVWVPRALTPSPCGRVICCRRQRAKCR